MSSGTLNSVISIVSRTLTNSTYVYSLLTIHIVTKNDVELYNKLTKSKNILKITLI